MIYEHAFNTVFILLDMFFPYFSHGKPVSEFKVWITP